MSKGTKISYPCSLYQYSNHFQ